MSLPLKDRIAVVTGASRGIGWHAALALSAAGAHIIAVARTVGALEELDDAIQASGGSATLVPLDLTDYDAIDRLGHSIYQRWGKLDCLFGNAGILGTLGPVSHVDVKDWEKVINVNVTANWRLIRSLDPLLRKSDAGRALFVTSGAAHKCKPYWGPYSASKAALEALIRSYAAEFEKQSTCVNLLNPGGMRTAMRAKAMPGEDPDTLPDPSEIAPHILSCLTPDCRRNGELFDFPTRAWKSFT